MPPFRVADAARVQLVADQVTFGYPGRPVLDAVSLVVSAGDRLGLVGENGNGDIEHELQTGGDLASEYLLMSMRLAEGMDLQRYRAKGGLLDIRRVVRLVENGLLDLSDDRARATSAGRPLLNYVLREMAG